jgi:allophanate hydrolase subunit 1
MTRRLLDFSPDALLVECNDLTETLGLMATLRDDPLPWVEEVVPGARTLLVRVSRTPTPAQRQRLLSLRASAPTPIGQVPLRVVVDYSGPDLADVAAFTGMTVDEVIRAHTNQIWTVGFCGFAPGFAYLRGESERLRVPRRASPRTRVPAGAVGLAGEWSGVYPREGPGGWQLIGRTELSLWDLQRDPPAVLRPGMTVRFVKGTRP